MLIRETMDGVLVYPKGWRFAKPSEPGSGLAGSPNDESKLSAEAESGKTAKAKKQTAGDFAGDFPDAEQLLAAIFGPRPEEMRAKSGAKTAEKSELSEEAKKEQAEKLKAKIEEVLKILTFREREVIKLRYGLSDGYTYTLDEVSRIFKVTRERVRQIEAKAVRKLNHPIRSRQLEGFLDHTSRHGTKQKPEEQKPAE